MRKAHLERNTNETKINLTLNLDGSGESHIDTGIGFLIICCLCWLFIQTLILI